ncbi:MAG: DNRLRE domain-containing protein [Armatimonadota bacterium]|nr:DNRLRE domain-containing protein [Armatimonadota bacterium]
MKQFIRALAAAAILSCCASCETWVVREPALVEDAALRDGEYSAFNFGASPLLQVGCLMGSEASAYNAVSLIRFDLSSVPCRRVTSAKLRLYKPKCFVQQRPVRIAIYEVPKSDRDWKEGSSECAADAEGASWQFRRVHLKWKTNLLSRKLPKDSSAQALDTAVAPAGSGQWIEFDLTPKLVQKWLDEPRSNSGILLRPADAALQWGDHAFFYSSEHYAGMGPELVIEGKPGRLIVPSANLRAKIIKRLPTNEKLERWLRSNRRLARFAKALALNKEQARVFCYIDTTVRCNLLIPRYKLPIALLNPRIESAAERGDEKELRKLLSKLRTAILTYEYIHDTQWYTAGPLAEILDARQLAELYAVHIFGGKEDAALERGQAIWQPRTGAALERAISETISRAAQKLALNQQQLQRIKPTLAQQKRKEEVYLARFRADLEKLKGLLRKPDSRPDELFALTRSMFFNHEAFLYYQSIYVGPRWHLFFQNAPITNFAKWLVEVRRAHYDLQRIQRELLEAQPFL